MDLTSIQKESHLAGCLKENKEPEEDSEDNKPARQMMLKAHDNLSSPPQANLPIRWFPVSWGEDYI